MQPCEADRLITQSRENLFIPQQATAVRLEHQHGCTDPPTSDAGCLLNAFQRIGRDGRKPDIEARSSSRRATDLHGPVMFPDDVTNGCEAETVALGTRREEWLENPLQRCFIHTAPGIGNRNHNQTTETDPRLPNPQPVCSFAHPDLTPGTSPPCH